MMREYNEQIMKEYGVKEFEKTDTQQENETDKGDVRTWNATELSLVESGRITTPEFKRDVFGEWEDWIDRAAEVKNATTDDVALGLLATAGSLEPSGQVIRAVRGMYSSLTRIMT